MASASNHEFKLLCPHGAQPQPGSLVTFSCHLSPEINAVDMEIRWFKETRCVCLYKNRQVIEGRGYKGRVSLFTQELERGNVSLQLKDCTESDLGHYLCQVTDGDRTEELALGFLMNMDADSPQVSVYICQFDREWTEEEKIKMEESALLAKYKTENERLSDDLKEKSSKLEKTEEELRTTKLNLNSMTKSLENIDQQLVEKDKELNKKNEQLKVKDTELKEKDTLLKEHLQTYEKTLTESDAVIMEMSKLLSEKDTQLENTVKELETSKNQQETLGQELQHKNSQLQEQMIKLDQEKTELGEKIQQLAEKNNLLTERETQLMERDKQLQEKDKLLTENAQTLQSKDKYLEEKDTELREVNGELQKTAQKLKENQKQMEEKERQLGDTDKELETNKNQLETLGQELQDKNRQLEEMMNLLEQQKTELAEKDKQLEEKTQLMERDKQLQGKEKKITHPDSSAHVKKRNSIDGLPPYMGGESSAPDPPLSVAVPELRLVLLGRMGSGKSAARNTILGSEKTHVAKSAAIQQSESTQGEVAGRKVTVVDTPDWFLSAHSLEKLRQDVELCVRLSAPGPHAFLLVIPVKQPTGEERGMLEKMEEILGERCWRNTMIIFTVTAEVQKKNIEEFIQSRDQEVQRLVENCGNRFHCLNIKESGDGSQVSELLEKIEKMVEGSREKFYSSEIYLEIESQIRAMETKILKEREEKKISEEREMREKLEKKVQDSLRKIEGVIQEHEGDIRQLDNRTTELERKMKEERDEEKKRELEKELKQEVEQRTEMEKKVKKLKEKRERDRREMEERHQQEMEAIRDVYEGEVRMEAERNIMKIILPELQRNILASKTKMQEEFSRQMEEKDRELETLKQKLSELTETHSLLEEVYEKTVRSSSEPERAALTGEASKGISQRFKDLFH
ncbi:hypothetical protein PHYPO_G00162120 [Pangasianodon hypophthalmus]|uniref:Ig-like domain-containing protein n=1 Tax=Pangasianodon hypophthalmus TaxID=310915 RepID=A0A5N5JTW3_PANHP|nr:hypothetical protein PHYPO_G00162120 [Pangasianodon hypophthalmus]